MLKLIFTLILSFSFLSAEPLQPKVLGWEQVLKDAQKKDLSTPVIPPLSAYNKETLTTTSEYEVVAIFSINNKKYAYLQTPDNKTIKVSSNMIIKELKIEEIDEKGLYISDKNGNKSYLSLSIKLFEIKDINFSKK